MRPASIKGILKEFGGLDAAGRLQEASGVHRSRADDGVAGCGDEVGMIREAGLRAPPGIGGSGCAGTGWATSVCVASPRFTAFGTPSSTTGSKAGASPFPARFLTCPRIHNPRFARFNSSVRLHRSPGPAGTRRSHGRAARVWASAVTPIQRGSQPCPKPSAAPADRDCRPPGVPRGGPRGLPSGLRRTREARPLSSATRSSGWRAFRVHPSTSRPPAPVVVGRQRTRAGDQAQGTKRIRLAVRRGGDVDPPF